MKVSLDRVEKDYHFEAKGASGVAINIDTTLDGPSKGASPMELILMGVASCNAVDVVNILKKQKQDITGYKMEVAGERKEVKQAKPFTGAHVNIYLEGRIDPKKALRAVNLSFDKYCSVSITLGDQVKITHTVFVNGEEVEA